MRRPFHLPENLDGLMRAKWLLPYLLVPPLLAVITHLEASLVEAGLVTVLTHKARLTLTIWNGAILLAAISGVQASLYFATTFRSCWLKASLALPVKRCRAYWGALIAVALISMIAFALTAGALVAALRSYGSYPWANILLSASSLILWVICASALLGTVANAFSSSIFILSTIAASILLSSPAVVAYHSQGGSSTLSVLLAVLPPIGRSFYATLGNPWHYTYPLVLLAHAAAAASLGVVIFTHRR